MEKDNQLEYLHMRHVTIVMPHSDQAYLRSFQ